MPIEEWDKLADGNIALGQVMGWELGMLPNQGLLRLDYAFSQQDLADNGKRTCQLSLSVAQLRELAELLLRAARMAEEQGRADQAGQ